MSQCSSRKATFLLVLAVVFAPIMQAASPHPHGGLAWQHISPNSDHADSPVLYQLIFRSSGTPGHIPAISPNHTLVNSPFSVGGDGSVAIGGLSISSTGIITFASGQTLFSSLNGQTGSVNITGSNGISVSANTGTVTVTTNATSNNTASTIVSRDSLGNFAAGTITLSRSLLLPGTTLDSSGGSGVLFLGVPFMHNFGSANAFVGNFAGNLTMTGGGNSGFGTYALTSITSGGSDSGFGVNALWHNTTGSNNSAFGAIALASNTTASDNSAFGTGSLTSNASGEKNSAFGSGAMTANTSGSFNTAFGFFSLGNNVTGSSNAAFGTGSLLANTAGNYNAAFGHNALLANTASSNSAFGYSALTSNTTGQFNSAFGHEALVSNTTGQQNSAFGVFALSLNTTGVNNSAFGLNALDLNADGASNSAMGAGALQSNTHGGDNSAFGQLALSSNTTGGSNVALGENALNTLTTGSSNIAVGNNAGSSLSAGESNNIYIGNTGSAGESNSIHIGTAGTQTKAFIAGAFGATSAGGVAVFVNSSGQLGTITSSERYKEQITNMDAESDVLMKLRPVSFYYKPELDSTHTRQYGLVAEEVAKIAPDLVVFNQDGKPETVRYHFVNAMLLNEVQKQKQLIEQEGKKLAEQQQQIDRLNAALESQRAAQQEQLKELMERLSVLEKSMRPETQLASAR